MARTWQLKEAASNLLMAVARPPDPGQAAEPPLPAGEPVKAPLLIQPLLSARVLRPLPQEKESLPVTVGAQSAGADLQNQAPIGERPLDVVPAISPLSPEQIADSLLPALENVKPFLAYCSLSD